MRSSFMRVLLAGLLAVALAIPLQAGAAPKLKRLGTDPAGDAPPALDLTYLDAGRNGSNLEIRIGIQGMTPGTGGYPILPGIQWQFTTGKGHYLAEAFVDGRTPEFLLFEIEGDTAQQMGNIEGTYDFTDGYISMLVPLEMIGARKGTTISGAFDEGDADSHVHTGVATEYSDYLTTTKSVKLR